MTENFMPLLEPCYQADDPTTVEAAKQKLHGQMAMIKPTPDGITTLALIQDPGTHAWFIAAAAYYRGSRDAAFDFIENAIRTNNGKWLSEPEAWTRGGGIEPAAPQVAAANPAPIAPPSAPVGQVDPDAWVCFVDDRVIHMIGLDEPISRLFFAKEDRWSEWELAQTLKHRGERLAIYKEI
jgi:hypothetical protein